MCRLMGVVSSRRAALSELLTDEIKPFTALACDHPDGWGIAHVDPTDRVVTVKEPTPAHLSDTYARFVDCTVTDAALLHIRLASPSLAVTHGNTHPFGDAEAAFAHNGYFAPADALDALIGDDLLATAGGGTDSERYYLAIRRRIDDGVEPAKAITWAAATIRAVTSTWVSLNCLYLTADALYAYADHDPESEVIGRRGPTFFDLGFRAEPDRVIVASRGSARPVDRWQTLPARRVMEIRRRDVPRILHEEW
jgi:predicted glutamine amidotransferase